MAPTDTHPEPAGKAAQIMAAATGLFLEHGYGATSMDAVAKAAGVSKATLYVHFPGKADLFAAIVGCECDRNNETLSAIELASLSVEEGLLRIGHRFVSLLLSPRGLAAYRMVVGESQRFPELGRAFYQSGPARKLQMVADYLEEARQRGELRIPDTALAAEHFLGMIRSHWHLRCVLGLSESPGEEEVQRRVRAAVTVFLDGYRTPA
jgi:AcrR family transcriptional regulator